MKYIFTLPLILLSFFSCEKESNYRFLNENESTIDNAGNTDNYPHDGSLVIHENFQKWKRDGYINLVLTNCEEDVMTSAVIMYRPDKPVLVQYDLVTVAYTLQDFAVNPACGNVAGTSTPDSEISNGYVALQQLIFYECGQHDSDALMTLSELPSISKVDFTVSYGGKTDEVGGLSLWKKGESDSKFIKIGDYKPEVPQTGEKFTVEINEKNIQLKFMPALTGKDNPINDGINRAIRIHDLNIWCMNY